MHTAHTVYTVHTLHTIHSVNNVQTSHILNSVPSVHTIYADPETSRPSPSPASTPSSTWSAPPPSPASPSSSPQSSTSGLSTPLSQGSKGNRPLAQLGWGKEVSTTSFLWCSKLGNSNLHTRHCKHSQRSQSHSVEQIFAPFFYEIFWINFGTKSTQRHTAFRISKKKCGLWS